MKTLTLLVVSLALVFTATAQFEKAYGQSVRAVDLLQDFATNEVAASLKYDGKRFSVGGIVAGVGIDEDRDPYILLSGSDENYSGARRNIILQHSGSLKCRFSESDTARIARVQKGSAIGFHGTVVGKSNGSVMLKDCSF